MKKTTAGLSGILIAAGLMLSACGGDSAEDLASEYCDMYEEVQAATEAQDTEKLAELREDLQDWVKENEDTDADEEDFTKAVKDDCGVEIPGLG